MLVQRRKIKGKGTECRKEDMKKLFGLQLTSKTKFIIEKFSYIPTKQRQGFPIS